MLNLEQTTVESRAPQRDPRMTLPRSKGDIPAEGLLGRRDFAVAPWVVVSVTTLAYAISEVIRGWDDGINAFAVAGATVVAVVTAILAAIQDRPLGLRYRHALWVYAVGGAAVLAIFSGMAMADAGVGSAIFGAVYPLATYYGFVSPPRWRSWSLGALLGAAVAVQLVTPAVDWFDLVVSLSLVAAAWACGVLVSVGQSRTARIVRRLGSYDRATRSLSRRGFMEQLERATAPRDALDEPVALLVVDCDLALAATVDGDGGARLLHWIGATVAAILPADAEFGRLGDGEFGVLLPGTPRHEAGAIAAELHGALHVRIPVTVGAATSETRLIEASDLYRVADAARLQAARAGEHHLSLVAGTVRGAGWQPPAHPETPVRRPAVAYRDIRATGKVPRVVEENDLVRRLGAISLTVVAAAGVPVIAHGVATGGDSLPDLLIRYGGAAWLLWVLTTAAASRRWARRGSEWFDGFLRLNGSASLVVGVSVAALSDGGVTSPIVAALFVAMLFVATVDSRDWAFFALACRMTGWAVVVALSPPDDLWIVPFHLALFAGCFMLGSIGRAAMDEVAAHARSRAHTDDLTQFSNRSGFVEVAREAFFVSATTTGRPFAMLTFRLDGLRAHNERHGYAAGDALLRRVADLLEDRIPAYYVIGRTGATEFSAAVMVAGGDAAQALTENLAELIREVTSVECGCATCPADGATVAALMQAAELKAGSGRSRVA